MHVCGRFVVVSQSVSAYSYIIEHVSGEHRLLRHCLRRHSKCRPPCRTFSHRHFRCGPKARTGAVSAGRRPAPSSTFTLGGAKGSTPAPGVPGPVRTGGGGAGTVCGMGYGDPLATSNQGADSCEQATGSKKAKLKFARTTRGARKQRLRGRHHDDVRRLYRGSEVVLSQHMHALMVFFAHNAEITDALLCK